MKTKIVARIDRSVFALLYRLKIYKAPLVGDGKTDNRRAMQARADVDGAIFGGIAVEGTYYLGKGVVHMKEGSQIIGTGFWNWE